MLQFVQYKYKRFVKLSALIYVLSLVLLTPFSLFAQQEPQFSQYMFNRLSYNPGYAGSNGAICLTGFYRNQWMGMGLTDVYGEASSASTGETMNFSFDMPVRFLHGGIGATIISDKIGYRDNIHIVWYDATLWNKYHWFFEFAKSEITTYAKNTAANKTVLLSLSVFDDSSVFSILFFLFCL